MTIAERFKWVWMTIQHRGILRTSKNAQFDSIYQISDPWQMESEREQLRFQETNRIIEQELGKIGTLLELGCGEGHQTAYLSRLCERLYGFDVSKAAVSRAQQRCPEARLSVADILSYQPELKKFDLVVACEILYYIKDVPAAISRMNELGARCMVTYYQFGPCNLDPFFSGIKGMKSKIIQAGDFSWKAVWWNTTRSRDEGPS